MSTARDSIEVAVPVAVAYEQLTHFENYPQFMSGVMSMAPIDASTAHVVLDIGGNRAEFDARITETRTDEFLCWEATDGPQVMEALRLEPVADDMTRVIAELQIDARELMPTEQHAVEILNRRLRSDLKGFKRFCEESAARDMAAETTSAPDMATASAEETSDEAKPRPSPATIARGIASASGLTHATNERPAQPAPPTGNLGPMQHPARPRQEHDL
ncbi:SRPBCC family protein [Dactylosporangium darangshiense]|uniref:Coenzyme Q-binding protein COQ10 START domain-containing protein n=1 Tax=Dactylosporangium darangshiense TaxID=579108 RepID=A0ABP8DTU6_9ACTN